MANTTKKTTKATKATAGKTAETAEKTAENFSAEERAAMKERAKEVRSVKKGADVDPEVEVLEKIAGSRRPTARWQSGCTRWSWRRRRS